MKYLSTVIGLIVLLVLAGLSFIDGNSMQVDSKWIPFLGRFHPVLLHLPIGLFAGVVLLEIYAMLNPVSSVQEKIHFLLSAAFYSTVVSALFGIFLSWEGGYESEALNFHKWGGVATAACILALDWLFKFRKSETGRISGTYGAGLVVTVAVISVTGHGGGSLTHGSDYLTEHLPFAQEPQVEEADENTPVFVSHIQPVLQDYCVQCHGAEKVKGELRLDTFEFMMAGGVNGPVIEPGNSEESTLLHVMHLPLDEDEHMPPKGKPQPSDDLIQLLAWWINQGASESATLDEVKVTPLVVPHFLEIEVLEFLSREVVDSQLESLPPNEAHHVYYLAQDDHRLGVRGSKATDEDLVGLLPLKSNIVELNLGKSQVTDEGLETIGQMTNLTHLHLNNTAITDAGLENLGNLYQLEYLNLYGTTVSDRGLLHLRRLKTLKKVFLWETKVTREGVAGLRESVFDAVGSEQLRLQIQKLNKERDALEVDIVSAFDFDLQTSVAEVPQESSVTASISDIMVEFHKGNTSLANQAKEGRAPAEDLRRMLESYQAMLELSPPEGSVEDWKFKTTALIDATNGLIENKPGSVKAYQAAVNCKACHSEHRTD